MTPSRRLVLKAASALPLLATRMAKADAPYPSKPIKIYVPASAGTSIDAMTRFFSDPLAQRLKTPVIVENRPGAGGLLGYMAAAKAAPDGYTLILTGVPLYLLPLFTQLPEPPYDAVRDFAAVARVASVPLAIVVPTDSPYKSMADLVKAMKAKPGEVTYSSQGVGSTAHLCSVILNELSRTKTQHISYKETTMAITDVVGGRVAFTCQSSTAVLPLVAAGKLRALAVTGSQRWQALPDIPTVAEAGVAKFDVSSQLDFMAPARTPAAIVNLLSEHLLQIAQTAEFKDFCAKQVITPEAVGALALGPEMAREAEKWKKLAAVARKS